MKIRKHILPIVAALACTLPAALAQFGGDDSNLIKNGKFELMNPDGFPEDWTISHPNYLKQTETEVQVLEEDGRFFYRVIKNAATGPGLGWQEFDLPPGTEFLRIAARFRGKGITRGAEGWQLPGISVTYYYSDDENDHKQGDVAKWITIPTGDSDWREYETVIPVRDSAPRARVGIIGAGWTGTMDVTDVVVEALD